MLFSVESNKLRATDPCYRLDVWCAGNIENVANGLWFVFPKYYEEPRDKRVAELVVVHESYKRADIKVWELANIEGGVDSGQFGFFDFGPWAAMQMEGIGSYGDENSFYGKVCELTGTSEQVGVLRYGAVSSSGWGDGCYPVYVHKNKDGVVVAARVVFISDEEEESEYDD